MAFTFERASKKQSRLRLGFVGPSGSGKTYSAIKVARALVGPEGRVAVIDTEHGSAAKYAGEFDFDVLELDTFAPTTYVQAIKAAEDAGYDVVVIDSLTHAWTGKEGALEQVDNAAARNRGNSYVAWRDVTPQHNALIDAIVGSRIHVIATMRAKTEYVLEDDGRGKKVPRKIGLAPVQRDGMEYEFDVVGDIDQDHKFVVTKTRCAALDNKVILKPGDELAATLLAWLTDGAPVPQPAAPSPEATQTEQESAPREKAKPAWADELNAAMEKAGVTSADLERYLDSKPTVRRITQWASENAGKTPTDLVQAVVEANTASAAASEPAPVTDLQRAGDLLRECAKQNRCSEQDVWEALGVSGPRAAALEALALDVPGYQRKWDEIMVGDRDAAEPVGAGA